MVRVERPSQHISWGELACKDGTPYPEEWTARAIHLGIEFEYIRYEAGGKPLRIGSAYRTEAWNRRVGGSRRSQHVQGRALDVYPRHGMSNIELMWIVMERARQKGGRIRGVGLYPWGVHFDIRPGKRIARWGGTRKLAELAVNA